MNLEQIMPEYTTSRKTRYGYKISCQKGLWSVEAPSSERAEKEALHYFAQYWGDGEYEPLKGESCIYPECRCSFEMAEHKCLRLTKSDI